MSTRLRLDRIVFDGGTQVRAAIDDRLVNDYAEAMTNGAPFPPLVVFHDGSQHFLADGFHRYMAAQRLAFVDFDVDVRPGTKEDALWFALGANKHGKTLGEADKKHAIELALRTWPDMSTTKIAEQVGCGHQYVSRIKNEVAPGRNLPDRVTGKDGKSYPAARSRPARTKADLEARWIRAKEMAEQGYTTRQMSDEFGVSCDAVTKGLRKYGIDVPADRVIGKSKRLDANRIVQRMVAVAENLTADVNLIDFARLDRTRIDEWVESLTASRRAVDVFIKRLKENKSKHGEAA